MGIEWVFVYLKLLNAKRYLFHGDHFPIGAKERSGAGD